VTAGPPGLRRFVKRPPGGTQSSPGPAEGAGPAGAAQAARADQAAPANHSFLPGRFAPGREAQPDREAGEAAAERCELCRVVLDGRHGHLVDTEKRSLACACRACYLLVTYEGGRFKAVPERVGHDPDHPLAAADWNELQIPVTMAFFFFNSALGRVVAGYPSPGGVTECELDLAAWDRLAAVYPLLGEMTPDVEAIFVHEDEVFLIPIDECYSLVGQLRLNWQGFDGGAEVREALAAFLTGLRQRAVAGERGH
jgi:hypothetical protein